MFFVWRRDNYPIESHGEEPSSTVPGQPPPAPASRGPHAVSSALARLSERGERSASCWNSLLYLWVLGPLGAAVILALDTFAEPLTSGNLADWSKIGPAIAFLICFSLLMGSAALAYAAAERRLVRRRLAASDLSERIAAGVLDQDLIFEMTPWPWRMLLPHGSDLPAQLWRVAANLDWYLGPPRRLLRPLWFYNILWAVAAIAAAAILYVGLASGGSLLNVPAMIMYSLALLLSIPQSFLQHRRQLWTGELALYLRERLEG